MPGFENPVYDGPNNSPGDNTGGYLVVETNPPSTTAASATLDVLNKRVLFIGINSLLTTILVVVAVVFSANGGGGGGTTSIESLGSVAASTSSEECSPAMLATLKDENESLRAALAAITTITATTATSTTATSTTATTITTTITTATTTTTTTATTTTVTTTSATISTTTTSTTTAVGESVYLNPGTYSWVAPTGVTSVCAVAVGAGGSGGMAGGGGGGLGWRNDIQVVPGQSYTVHVGLGAQSADYNHVGTAGERTYFIETDIVRGNGGTHAPSHTVIGRGGSFIGTGGGNGGNGGSAHSESGGGGGAGGYSGNGGDGGKGTASASGDGGGVGIYGQGASGAGGIEGCTNSYWPGNAEDGKPGQGGGGGGGGGGNSCGGSNGGHGSSTTATTVGSGSGRFYDTNKAGDGAVRIIWGPGRSFPSDAASAGTPCATRATTATVELC